MVAHIDADGFFAACEVARRPHLQGKPVMVLGKLGGFVLAKTEAAKACGVKTVMRLHEAKKLCPHGIFLSGDLRYYTVVSRQLMSLLKTWSPVVQVTSIDEAFIDFTGLSEMHKTTDRGVADAIRKSVSDQLGITVSVGVAPNKTLAKMGSEANKPNGTTMIDPQSVDAFLKTQALGDIPGIGQRRQAFLEGTLVRTAYDFAQLPYTQVKKWFGITGVFLWRELNGESSFPLKPEREAPKQIGRTSSFRTLTPDPTVIVGMSQFHLERALESLHQWQLTTQKITLYLRTKELKRFYLEANLKEPTRNFQIMVKALTGLYQKIPIGFTWRSAGVFLTDLRPDTGKQLNLFDPIADQLKNDQLEAAKQALNQKYGHRTIMSGSMLLAEQEWRRDYERLIIANTAQ
ncbi:DNA polymerase IV [Candidatus Peregrinibacteria bacterium]|nr:MAG: DNA polymerase IV [Candidatus Peregrinibacteria bacterium]